MVLTDACIHGKLLGWFLQVHAFREAVRMALTSACIQGAVRMALSLTGACIQGSCEDGPYRCMHSWKAVRMVNKSACYTFMEAVPVRKVNKGACIHLEREICEPALKLDFTAHGIMKSPFRIWTLHG